MTLGLKLRIVTLWLALLLHASAARQIRLNRFGVQIVDDDKEIVATVRELQPTPYPAAGYRPGRAFNLPNEITTTEATILTTTTAAANEADSTTESATAAATTTTVESATDGDDENLFSTSTATPLAPFLFEPNSIEARQLSDAQTDAGNEVAAAAAAAAEMTTAANDVVAAKTPYPAAGYRPSRAFNLPTENQASEAKDATATTTEQPSTDAEQSTMRSTDTTTPASNSMKAPYPAAGYRPRCAFHLPNELPATSARNTNEESTPAPAASNANHPACGTSTNPLAPKPPNGSTDDPDAVWIVATNNPAPAALQIPIRSIVAANVPHAQAFIAAVPVARQFITYSPPAAPMQTWQLQ